MLLNVLLYIAIYKAPVQTLFVKHYNMYRVKLKQHFPDTCINH